MIITKIREANETPMMDPIYEPNEQRIIIQYLTKKAAPSSYDGACFVPIEFVFVLIYFSKFRSEIRMEGGEK